MSEVKLEFIGKQVKDMYGTHMGKVIGMVTANDLMKEDVELVYIKYQKRLQDLEDNGKIVLEQLQERLNQIDTESQNIKSVLFDAKLQYRSNEITEETYQQISLSTNDLIEHINLEKGEINNVISRLSQQTFERMDLNSVQNPTMSDQPKSNLSLESNSQSIEGDIPVTGPQAVNAAAADNDNNDNDHPKTIRKENDDEAETSWLNEVLQHD